MSTQIQIEKDNLAYTPERAQFELGVIDQVFITVFDDTNEDAPTRTFGPYQTDTAIHWATKARSAVYNNEDPIVLLDVFNTAFKRRQAGNDWTGMIPGL